MSIAAEPIDAEEAFHNGFYYFLRAVETLSREAEHQCQEMGDFNVAWELKDDVMAGRYLVGSGFLPALEAQCIANLLDALEPLPVNDMPAGERRAPNLEAMEHPAWEPLRLLARHVLVELRRFRDVNRAYFKGGADAA